VHHDPLPRTPSRCIQAQLAQGVEPLRRLIALMPDLRVVLLAGKDAQAAWDLFCRSHGVLVQLRGIKALGTYHPSRQALQHPDSVERARREDHIRTTLRRAAELIGFSDGSTCPSVEAADSDVAGEPVSVVVVNVDVAARPATLRRARRRGGLQWPRQWGRHVPDGIRFAVEVEFRIPSPNTRNDAWDLDNLIKPTLDALGGVIGGAGPTGAGRPTTSASTASSPPSGLPDRTSRSERGSGSFH
jgi:hypothetical protein